MGGRLGESQDLAAELWIVELGRPPRLVYLDPQPLAGRIKLLEIDPAGPVEPDDLDSRLTVLRDDDALTVLRGHNDLREPRLRLPQSKLHLIGPPCCP